MNAELIDALWAFEDGYTLDAHDAEVIRRAITALSAQAEPVAATPATPALVDALRKLSAEWRDRGRYIRGITAPLVREELYRAADALDAARSAEPEGEVVWEWEPYTDTGAFYGCDLAHARVMDAAGARVRAIRVIATTTKGVG